MGNRKKQISLISVLITAYNSSKTITKTIESIFNQSFKKWELIIVDDGSSDDTKEKILGCLGGKENFKLIPSQHIGRGPALNLGVKNASYEWVAIQDADDLWHPDKLQYQVDVIKKYGGTVDLICSQHEDFTDESKINFQNFDKIIETKITQKDFTYINPIGHATVVMKKSLANYDASRTTQLDLELWLRLINQGCKIIRLEIPLLYHRIHDGQNFEGKKRISYAIKAYKLMMSFAIKRGMIWAAIIHTAKLIYHIIRPRNWKVWFGKN